MEGGQGGRWGGAPESSVLATKGALVPFPWRAGKGGVGGGTREQCGSKYSCPYIIDTHIYI